MTDQQLLDIQQQMFFQLGIGKIDLYHFPTVREVVIVKHGNLLIEQNVLKVFKY
jgi:hypothetical protein